MMGEAVLVSQGMVRYCSGMDGVDRAASHLGSRSIPFGTEQHLAPDGNGTDERYQAFSKWPFAKK